MSKLQRTSTSACTLKKTDIPPRFKHQNYSLTRCRETPILFDMSDPGTGKTRVQIDAFTERRRKRGGKALILATKSLLDSAWRRDFRSYAPDMVVSIAYASNREEALSADCDVVVTNHDAVKALVKHGKKFWAAFDTIIIDESTAFKHHTSQRSKALAKLVQFFKYRVCMSGTPTSNGILDIWHQVLILDDGKRLGKSFYGFRAAACEPIQISPKLTQLIKWQDKDGVDTVVADMLKDITVRHQFEDCVDIPENHRYAVPFALPKTVQTKYNDMQDFHFVKLKSTGVTAVNAAVVYGKLLQIASGAVYDDSGHYSLLDISRYSLILDIVEERQHSIVFFHWEHQRDELVKEATKRGLSFAVFDGSTSDKQRSNIVKDYQEGRYQVLLAHPQSAGHGLTLTKGTATIWASPTYNLEHFLQGLKRIHRIGQTQRTETIVIVAEGTIDEKVWDVMQRKDAKQGDLLKMMTKEIE